MSGDRFASVLQRLATTRLLVVDVAVGRDATRLVRLNVAGDELGLWLAPVAHD